MSGTHLLKVAIRGGWIGAKLAQRRFRRKTRKEPFRSQSNRIGLWQGVGAALILDCVVATPLLLTGQDRFAAVILVEPAPHARGMPRRFGPGS